MKRTIKAGLAILTALSLVGCGTTEKKKEERQPVVTLCNLSGLKLSIKAVSFTEADVIRQANTVLKANGVDVTYDKLTDAYCRKHFKNNMNLKSKRAVYEYAKFTCRRSSVKKLSKAKNKAMEDYLLENCDVSFVPEKSVKAEENRVKKSYALFADLEKKPLKKYVKTQGYASLDDFNKKVEKEAPERARLNLIESAVAVKKKIKVSRKEKQKVAESYEKAGIPSKKLYDCYGGQAAFAAQCRRARALQKLVEETEFKED